MSDYWTSAQTEEAIADFVTSADVKTQVEAYNYITSADAKTQIEGYNYVNSGDVKTQVEEYHYVVSGDVKTQVEAYEYVNSGQVETQILAKNYLTAEDIEPDLIYSGDPGFYAINSSALTSWQLENLDLSNYNFVRFYIKASDIAFNSSDNFTAPMYVDVVLDPKSLSSQYQAYLGVTTNLCAGNRNRSFTTIAAVDITKSKVQVLFEVSLWDVSTSSAAANGRYCYKIEGYKYNVCGAAENGGGGEAYTAGANINISPANVISVSGLATVNGSALTAGGNIEIAIPDMSAYYTSAQTEAAITGKNYVTSAQVETQITGKSYITSAYVADALTSYTPTTGFSTINGSAITNGGNITIQGGGGGGISQADLASSGYLYYDNGSTNLNQGAVGYLNADNGGKLVNYDHDTYQPATYGVPGDAPYPKHIMSIWQSDYDFLVDIDRMNLDSNTLYIVLPDPQ